MSYKIQARITIKIQGIYILSKLTQLSVAGLKANTIPTHSRHSENGSLGNFSYKLSGEKIVSQLLVPSFFIQFFIRTEDVASLTNGTTHSECIVERGRNNFPKLLPIFLPPLRSAYKYVD